MAYIFILRMQLKGTGFFFKDLCRVNPDLHKKNIENRMLDYSELNQKMLTHLFHEVET